MIRVILSESQPNLVKIGRRLIHDRSGTLGVTSLMCHSKESKSWFGSMRIGDYDPITCEVVISSMESGETDSVVEVTPVGRYPISINATRLAGLSARERRRAVAKQIATVILAAAGHCPMPYPARFKENLRDGLESGVFCWD